MNEERLKRIFKHFGKERQSISLDEKVIASPAGSGTITGITAAGYPQVNEIAVVFAVFEDGSYFGHVSPNELARVLQAYQWVSGKAPSEETAPEEPRASAWIQTYSGGRFFFDEYMAQSDVRMEDIVHALSNINRFNGHVKSRYSVAQHSILGSLLARDMDTALAFLLHDAHEAYIGDIVSPLKRILPGIAEFEEKVKHTVWSKLYIEDLMEKTKESVHVIDMMMLDIESKKLFHGGRHPFWPILPHTWEVDMMFFDLRPWDPKATKQKFRNRLFMLTRNEHAHLWRTKEDMEKRDVLF